MYNLSELREARPDRLTIDVPEWGGAVTLQRMTSRDQLDLVADLDAISADDLAADEATRGIATMVRLIRHCVVDESGAKVFDNAEGEKYLETESMSLIYKVGREAMRLHDMGADETESVGDQKKTD